MDRTSANACCWLLLALLCAPAALATTPPEKAPADPTSDQVMMTGGFLSAHPDLRFRLLGQEEMKQGNHKDAFAFFQRAAWYGDKPSQGMVAEMLWNGQGVAQDRAQAYAWMDLAAERGYEGFLVLRERYWKALDESERERAIEAGRDVYARYGDQAAEPRLAAVLRRERRRQTGSRTGFAGNVQIYVNGPDGSPLHIDGTDFYDDRYWKPTQYREWQDSIWMKPRTGNVQVGDVEQVQDPEPSRIPATAPKVDAEEPKTPERDDATLGAQPPR